MKPDAAARAVRRDAWRSSARLAIATLLARGGCSPAEAPAPSTTLNRALPAETVVPPTWTAAADDSSVADNWLAAFQDPRLDAIVAEALANNTDLAQAAARVVEAEQSVVVVGSQLLPQIGAGAAVHGTLADRYADPGRPSGGTTFISSAEGARIAWEVDVWGRLRAQRAASEAGYQATALDYAFARQSLAATVVKSWFQVVETGQLLALAERSAQIYVELLSLVKMRQAAGKVADLDVAEAEGSLYTAQSEVSRAHGIYSEARRNLEVLLGRYPAAEIRAAQAAAPLPNHVPLGLLSRCYPSGRM
jgi:outer membrane protein TolC